MKIGKIAFDTVERTVEEVEAGLLQMTGIAVHEMHVALAYPCLAGTVAAALLPLLAKPLERHALAEALAAHGVDDIRAKVRALYDELMKPEAASGEAKA